MKNLSLKNKLNIVELYNSNKQIKDIANQYELSICNLRNWLKKQKEVNWRGRKRISVNECYFDDIDTPNKAYIVGFISADGHVDNELRPGISIQLQERDKQILQEIKKELSYMGEIRDCCKRTSKSGIKKYSRLRICSKKLANTLTSYGIHNKKTYGFSLPSCISKNNFRHFLRGYFDGDGCLYVKANEGKSSGPRYAATIVCEKSFACQLHSLLSEWLGITFRIVQQKSKIIRCLVIDSALSVEKFMTWLYDEGGMKLNRKYEKFLEMKELRRTRNNFTRRALSPDKVKEVRNILKTGVSMNKTAKQFQVSRATIKSIKDNTGYLDVV